MVKIEGEESPYTFMRLKWISDGLKSYFIIYKNIHTGNHLTVRVHGISCNCKWGWHVHQDRREKSIESKSKDGIFSENLRKSSFCYQNYLWRIHSQRNRKILFYTVDNLVFYWLINCALRMVVECIKYISKQTIEDECCAVLEDLTSPFSTVMHSVLPFSLSGSLSFKCSNILRGTHCYEARECT